MAIRIPTRRNAVKPIKHAFRFIPIEAINASAGINVSSRRSKKASFTALIGLNILFEIAP